MGRELVAGPALEINGDTTQLWPQLAAWSGQGLREMWAGLAMERSRVGNNQGTSLVR